MMGPIFEKFIFANGRCRSHDPAVATRARIGRQIVKLKFSFRQTWRYHHETKIHNPSLTITPITPNCQFHHSLPFASPVPLSRNGLPRARAQPSQIVPVAATAILFPPPCTTRTRGSSPNKRGTASSSSNSRRLTMDSNNHPSNNRGSTRPWASHRNNPRRLGSTRKCPSSSSTRCKRSSRLPSCRR